VVGRAWLGWAQARLDVEQAVGCVTARRRGGRHKRQSASSVGEPGGERAGEVGGRDESRHTFRSTAVVSVDGRARGPPAPIGRLVRAATAHARVSPHAAPTAGGGRTRRGGVGPNTAAPPTAQRRPRARTPAAVGAHLAAGRRRRRLGAISPPPTRRRSAARDRAPPRPQQRAVRRPARHHRRVAASARRGAPRRSGAGAWRRAPAGTGAGGTWTCTRAPPAPRVRSGHLAVHRTPALLTEVGREVTRRWGWGWGSREARQTRRCARCFDAPRVCPQGARPRGVDHPRWMTWTSSGCGDSEEQITVKEPVANHMVPLF